MQYGMTNWFRRSTPTKQKLPSTDSSANEQHDSVRELLNKNSNAQTKPSVNTKQKASNSETSAEIYRMCDECEEELQRSRNPQKADSNLTADAPPLGNGQPLPQDMRNYFEPRFGTDFSHVRIHRDEKTAGYANSINARAFTYGNNIGFSQGAFGSDSSSKKLLAHELTHVVQQGEESVALQSLHRNVAFTNCQSGVHDAPPSPELFLALDEMMATSDITWANMQISFAIQTLQGGTRPPDTQKAFSAYLLRFGLPEQLASGRFRERFGGQAFDTENEAIISELETIKTRLERIRNFFNRNLRYTCVSDSANTSVGTCTESCDGAFAWVCTSGAPNTIVICPNYWGLGPSDNGVGLIHEVSHLIFGFGDPAGGTMTTRLRGRNPVCYSGFVASVRGNDPPDPDCPVLALPAAAAPAPAPAPAPGVHPKLKIGAVNSPEEKQADAVAEAMVSGNQKV